MHVPPRAGSPCHTFPCRLDGDFLADVATAGRGDGGHPQHVLLPAVQVGDAVEELVGAGLVLAGGLQRGPGEGTAPVRPTLNPITPSPATLAVEATPAAQQNRGQSST